MSDRIPAEIWIGGKLAASAVPDLCAAVTDEGICLEWGGPRVAPTGRDDLIAAIKANHQGVRLLWFCDEEACCGEFDVLESFLRAQDIPFTRRTDGRYEYDPVKVEFRPGCGQVDLAADRSGEAVVPANTADRPGISPDDGNSANSIRRKQAGDGCSTGCPQETVPGLATIHPAAPALRDRACLIRRAYPHQPTPQAPAVIRPTGLFMFLDDA